jgi:hypothetical protein
MEEGTVWQKVTTTASLKGLRKSGVFLQQPGVHSVHLTGKQGRTGGGGLGKTSKVKGSVWT